MNTPLARRLKASRIEAGYAAPKDIAPLIGRSTRQVNNYEQGVVPPADVLQKWAQATNKTLEYFLEQDKQEAPERVTHPGIESLAQDAATLTRYGITPDELDLLRSGIYPVTIMERRDALDMLLVLRRPMGKVKLYRKTPVKPPISRSPARTAIPSPAPLGG